MTRIDGRVATLDAMTEQGRPSRAERGRSRALAGVVGAVLVVALLQVPTGLHPEVAAGAVAARPVPVVAVAAVTGERPLPPEDARVAAGRRPAPPARSDVAGRLAQIRHCESRGDYMAVSPSGRFRGAYQFVQSTWDAVAADAGRVELVGIDPIRAAPVDQDALAAHLLEQMPGGGVGHWPVCGRGL